MAKRISPFPRNFLWGTSSAAHQVEGETRNSDWWHWAVSGHAPFPGVGCDHYRLYEEDFLLMQKMHHTAHRLSIEWSRIFPQEGVVNRKEIDHYKKVLLSLKDKHIQSFVTLHHMTSPQWFSNKGGFKNKANNHFFLDFVTLCAKEFGDLVDFWITVNEPVTYAAKSYLLGNGPPGEKNIITAFRVFLNLASVHNASYVRIKKTLPQTQVGSSHVLTEYVSGGGVSGFFLPSLFHFVNNSLYFILTKKSHDFVGINCYYRAHISLSNLYRGLKEEDYEGVMRDERHDLGLFLDSTSIYTLLKYAWDVMKKPLYITEHGISDPTDTKRIGHMNDAVTSMQRAREDGVDIRGYLHWSFLDNYEWSSGFSSKFGLVSVDPKTKKRTPKKSARYFSSVIKRNEPLGSENF
ncbi:glycoside hydrolase family 1 protein [Candidatus Gottesmanbacteria bacterium]|nr:glycoside hydrolase family 1 protein [Candidatus Gottesmanbacteria bacterium]